MIIHVSKVLISQLGRPRVARFRRKYGTISPDELSWLSLGVHLLQVGSIIVGLDLSCLIPRWLFDLVPCLLALMVYPLVLVPIDIVVLAYFFSRRLVESQSTIHIQ